MNKCGFSALAYPWIMGCLIIMLCGIGFRFISNGVDADFNATKICVGMILFVSGLGLLMFGVIHGDLVPWWLSVSLPPGAPCGAPV
jgi:hypothetical membrane protein